MALGVLASRQLSECRVGALCLKAAGLKGVLRTKGVNLTAVAILSIHIAAAAASASASASLPPSSSVIILNPIFNRNGEIRSATHAKWLAAVAQRSLRKPLKPRTLKINPENHSRHTKLLVLIMVI